MQQRLDRYSREMPELQRNIPQRHQDMPYRRLLKLIAGRLERHIE